QHPCHCSHNNRVPCLHPHQTSCQSELFLQNHHLLKTADASRSCRTQSIPLEHEKSNQHLQGCQDDKCRLESLEGTDSSPTQEDVSSEYLCHDDDGQGCMSSCDSSLFSMHSQRLAFLSPSLP